MLSVPPVFYRPRERQEEADAAREKFFVTESDHLTLLHVYKQWESNGARSDWCNRHFLHQKSLKKAREVRTQLIDIMKQQRVAVVSCNHDWDVIRQAICSAYFANAAMAKANNEYVNLRTKMPCHLHPTSALYGLGYTADYVVYHELIMTSKEFMQCVTAVDPLWLADMGPMFFSVKESYRSRLLQRRKEREAEELMELQYRKAELDKQIEAKKTTKAAEPKPVAQARKPAARRTRRGF